MVHKPRPLEYSGCVFVHEGPCLAGAVAFSMEHPRRTHRGDWRIGHLATWMLGKPALHTCAQGPINVTWRLCLHNYELESSMLALGG